ncbi:MAG: 4Fe-4S binding protein [Candidatus Caldarchaeales archaeon]
MSEIDVKKIIRGQFSWRTLPPAAMVLVPTSLEYKTYTWRIERPEIDQSKCTRCLLCWVYCPDMSIRRLNDGRVEIYYEFCKGCGICAEVCPSKAIKMVEE